MFRKFHVPNHFIKQNIGANQTQKPSHRIQNRQNNMKHIALISAKLKYIHSMYTYTHKQNINIHTDQMDSKAKSTQQIK